MDRGLAQRMVGDALAMYAPTRVAQGWRFGRFTRGVKTLGVAHYGKKTIDLSGPFVDQYGVAEVMQTILHEVAHAVAGPDANHGPTWKRTARRIGYTGEREARHIKPLAPPLWEGTCGQGCTVGYMRKPGLRMQGGWCRKHLITLTWTNTRTGEVIQYDGPRVHTLAG